MTSRRNPALTTTEVPTYFGPSDSPLFGVVHLPVDKQIRGGVVICGSLGKEAMDSARLHRSLAESLVDRGFGVLRFDYLGTGDSAFGQVRDDSVANWIASVGHALDYLVQIGAESLSAIGIRAGGLILREYLAQCVGPHGVENVAYLDPAGTGRRYLREHTTLFRVAVGEDASPHGEVSVIGGRFSDRAATDFSALRLRADPVSAHTLVVIRPGETERHLTALASAEGVESVVAEGLPDCARPRDVLLPVPAAAVDAIATWFDAKNSSHIHCATPEYRFTTTMSTDGFVGFDVVESIERVGLQGLFAIRTRPRRCNSESVKTVVFFVAAKDSHVGPAREWVELSRRLAAEGVQAVRWDPAGLGLSAHIDRDPYRSVYHTSDIVDSVAVARHACRDADQLELVGICSGSWYAAHTARITGAKSAILVNQLAWSWRVSSTVLSQWYHRKLALDASSPPARGGGAVSVYSTRESKVSQIKARLSPAWDTARGAMHQHVPRWLLRTLTWVGLAWLPEVVLNTLARRGTAVTVIISPDDDELFTARGGRAAVDRLESARQTPILVTTSLGDHSASHPAILSAIREVVLPATAWSEPADRPRVASAR